MELNQLKLALGPLFEAGIVPFLWGETQIGKSESIEQFCSENDRKLVDLRLSQLEPGDMLGMMDTDEGRTKWCVPDWWPREGERAVLFLDEFNRVKDPAMEASTFQLIRDRRLHTHRLPSDCDVLAAGNPAKGHKIQEMTDRALIARFCHIVIEPSVFEWLDHASQKGVDPSIRSFIAADSKHLSSEGEADIEIKARPNRRGWMLLSKFMDIAKGRPEVDDKIRLEVSAGLVGIEAANAYNGWLALGSEIPPSGKEILENPKAVAKKIKEKLEDDQHDWVRAVAYNFVIDAIPHEDPEWGATGVRNALEHIGETLPEEYTVLIARKIIQTDWTKRKLRTFDRVISVLQDVFPDNAA